MFHLGQIFSQAGITAKLVASGFTLKQSFALVDAAKRSASGYEPGLTDQLEQSFSRAGFAPDIGRKLAEIIPAAMSIVRQASLEV